MCSMYGKDGAAVVDGGGLAGSVAPVSTVMTQSTTTTVVVLAMLDWYIMYL